MSDIFHQFTVGLSQDLLTYSENHPILFEKIDSPESENFHVFKNHSSFQIQSINSEFRINEQFQHHY